VTGIGYGTARRAFAGRAPAGATVTATRALAPRPLRAVPAQKPAPMRKMAAAG
jgi:hypothetical protein